MTVASADPDGDAERRLIAVLATMPKVAIAVSGGIDSLTLATIAHRTMRRTPSMLHASSPAVPDAATARVRRLAAEQGWALAVIDAEEFKDPNYMRNPVNRCFYCKSALYGTIARHTDAQIVSGANVDDLGEYRPGMVAAKDNDVRHPYIEAGIAKATVRVLARRHGLGELAELPAAPCLASRVETGIAIRGEVLRAIDAVETFVRAAVRPKTVRCRVRDARIMIEVDAETLARLDDATRGRILRETEDLFAPLQPNTTMGFAEYRNGSAFLRVPNGGD
jgi:pyridinium-3,5-biscarboxylic acid mononucleotide sulfurtransferase